MKSASHCQAKKTRRNMPFKPAFCAALFFREGWWCIYLGRVCRFVVINPNVSTYCCLDETVAIFYCRNKRGADRYDAEKEAPTRANMKDSWWWSRAGQAIFANRSPAFFFKAAAFPAGDPLIKPQNQLQLLTRLLFHIAT